MAWRRLPSYLPNLPLKLMPLKEPFLQQLKETGWLREAAFRTVPSATKAEIKAYIQSIYGMAVEKVHTINYMGKKKRAAFKGRPVYYRLPDWKKVYVVFKPAHMQGSPTAASQAQASAAGIDSRVGQAQTRSTTAVG